MMLLAFSCAFSMLIIINTVDVMDSQAPDTVHLVIQLKNGSTVEQVATHHSIQTYKKILSQDDLYHVACPTGELQNVLNSLRNDKRVCWVEHQVGRYRAVRSIRFNDPYYPEQWYLHNEGQTGSPVGNDLNVVPVWEAGFYGAGVVVSVLDDGLLHSHPDISANYNGQVSTSVVHVDDDDHDPSPRTLTEDNSHGTYCAAVIASVANNSLCGVGIAHKAQIGGVRIIDGKVSDLQEALALNYALDKVDIYSASWGPRDDGRQVSRPGKLAAIALKTGIRKGRGGKGAIYVWAVGNGRHHHDNCNMDGYVSSIYTVAIGALTPEGLSAVYSEGCASILASTFVGGLHKYRSRMDVINDDSSPKVVVPELDGGCSESFQGTSAASPQAAAVIALALEANPELNWRDIQHLIITSARIPNPDESGWIINGAGLHFHLNYGFGVLDAAVLVSKAQRWPLVGRQNKLTVKSLKLPRNIVCGGNISVTVLVTGSHGVITRTEHVIATANIIHRRRSKLNIFLRSPAGTVSQLLTHRTRDNSTRGISMWPFMSVHFWNEIPEGLWTLNISDSSTAGCQFGRKSGQINFLSLQIFGTKINKRDSSVKTLRKFRLKNAWKKSQPPTKMALKAISELEKKISNKVKIHAKKLKKKIKG